MVAIKNLGICTKCKQHTCVVMHHTKGYYGEYKDYVLPYCYSCHLKIHKTARKQGTCKMPTTEIGRLSSNSSKRRSPIRGFILSRGIIDELMYLEETLYFNIVSNKISVDSHVYFSTQYYKYNQ